MQRDLSRFAWLSIGAALVTIFLKASAFVMTGSVGLLSDAAESSVNLVAAVLALFVLKIIARPADRDHEFGHSKAEYFSSGVEGAMILVAAVFIIVTATERLINPAEVSDLDIGLILMFIAAVINGVVGLILIRAGKEHRSITLTADGKHLLTDVWTSVGVIIGIGLVWITGWQILDPIVALLVALNILVAGWNLMRESVGGLMDKAMDGDDRGDVDAILDAYRSEDDDIDVHEIRTRVSGRQEFIEFHVLVPGEWTVDQGHDLVESMEEDLRERFPGVHIASHLEPVEDERAYDDVDL